MRVLWSPDAWQDYLYWSNADPKRLARINRLIAEIQRLPFAGIGKPEPLKGDHTGFWSRRIDGEHRLVYRVEGKGEGRRLEIVQCRYHY